MASDRRNVMFPSCISTYNNCVCDACHGMGYVIKVDMPKTQYFDGKRLTTRTREYWLCRECRDKLVKALEWEDAEDVDLHLSD